MVMAPYGRLMVLPVVSNLKRELTMEKGFQLDGRFNLEKHRKYLKCEII